MRLIRLVQASKFQTQLQLVMLQGVALAGFNVIDAHQRSAALEVPVLIVVTTTWIGWHSFGVARTGS
jgi:endonuclease V-like protein UPF0215 family